MDDYKDPFSPYIHTSPYTPYPHADYKDALGKLHLGIDEAQFLAQKRGIELKPTESVLPSMLKDLLK